MPPIVLKTIPIYSDLSIHIGMLIIVFSKLYSFLIISSIR